MSISSYSVFTYNMMFSTRRRRQEWLDDVSGFLDLTLTTNPSLNILYLSHETTISFFLSQVHAKSSNKQIYCTQGGACIGTCSNSKENKNEGRAKRLCSLVMSFAGNVGIYVEVQHIGSGSDICHRWACMFSHRRYIHVSI